MWEVPLEVLGQACQSSCSAHRKGAISDSFTFSRGKESLWIASLYGLPSVEVKYAAEETCHPLPSGRCSTGPINHWKKANTKI